jgi:hypothetical protein
MRDAWSTRNGLERRLESCEIVARHTSLGAAVVELVIFQLLLHRGLAGSVMLGHYSVLFVAVTVGTDR